MSARSTFPLLALLGASALPAGPADGGAEVPELARAAKQAPTAVAAVYRALAKPYDEVRLADGKTVRVPLGTSKPSAVEGKVESIISYEQIALKEVERLLADKKLAAAEQARAAETILTAVLRFHLSHRERAGDDGGKWKELTDRLRGRLLEARRLRLRLLASSARGPEDWEEVLKRADLLAEQYPDDRQVRAEAADAWAAYAEDRLKAGEYARARAQLERIEREFLNHPRAAALGKALRAKAEALVKEADGLDGKDQAEAKLRAALAAWPRLPGLRDRLLKLQKAYPILYVGVRQLPDNLSPATAWTDPERWAVELLFERLVWQGYDTRAGELHGPGLAAELPEAVPGGRRLRLDPDTRWSDGRRVTSGDVRHTFHLLASPALPGRSPVWADLVEPPTVGNDPFRLEFRYRHPGPDPLLPLGFHVLPETFRGQALVRADQPEFARNPVGSGPFVYAGRKDLDGRHCAVFVANPHYYRSDRPGEPQVREIRFYVPADPVADFRHSSAPLRLLPGLTTEQADHLRQQGVRGVETLKGRRVHFLAVNHRMPVLAHRSLRLAIAHGIDREKILKEHFRGAHPSFRVLGTAGSALAAATSHLGKPQKHHEALNGLYPARSWACAEPNRVPADLHDPDRARAQLRLLKEKEKVEKVELTLKYSTDDPRAAGACKEIAGQLAAVGKAAGCSLQITPVGLGPAEFRRALEGREYELAYHHHDHESEAYWIGPLFDPRPTALAEGGSNYLGYHNDAELESLFRSALAHRDFVHVRKITHNIHAHLHDRMPLVPLWQLDVHIVVHPDLNPAGLDPLRLFTRVAEWEMK